MAVNSEADPAVGPLRPSLTPPRILVLGSSGAGKTTFASQLGARLGIEVIHLDSHFWGPGWKPSGTEAWNARLASLLKKRAWVMDGNYPRSLAWRLTHANQVILLDLPRPVCLFRCGKRLLANWGRTRKELAPGCYERMNLEFFLWIWRYPQAVRPFILAELAKLPPAKEVVVLKSGAAAADYLRRLDRLSGDPGFLEARTR